VTQTDGTSEQTSKDASATRALDRQRATAEATHDATLVLRLRQRDEEALAALYDRHGRTIYSIALAILHDSSRAEDVTQDVFLTLWQQPERFDPALGRFAPWCYRIARNRAIDLLRQRRRDVQPADAAVFELMLGSASDAPEETVVSGMEAVRVRQALAKLVPEQRQVLELAYFGGLSQSQMAEELGIPLGTIKTRVRTGLLRLRELLDDG
jgi:RNA polymerase sigma-70 factor (ECF subfamily)